MTRTTRDGHLVLATPLTRRHLRHFAIAIRVLVAIVAVGIVVGAAAVDGELEGRTGGVIR